MEIWKKSHCTTSLSQIRRWDDTEHRNYTPLYNQRNIAEQLRDSKGLRLLTNSTGEKEQSGGERQKELWKLMFHRDDECESLSVEEEACPFPSFVVSV